MSLVLGMTGVARSEPFDLKACVDAALSISPQVRAADTDLEIAEALADQAEAVRYLPNTESVPKKERT